MKRLRFHYEMQLVFNAVVVEHHYLFRCLPMEGYGQNCYGLKYRIEPSGRIWEQMDGFGNRVCMGEAMEPHDRLNVWAEGTVFVDRSITEKEKCHPIFCFQSAYTMVDEALNGYLKECCEKYQDGKKDREKSSTETYDKAFLRCLMDCLHRDFSYKPGNTDITTTAAQAWAVRAGVCQDYAHIFLALCRKAGYPARYVAGMMVGEGATHAWTEVYLDGVWVGFDPTNNCLAGDNYIKLSHGRDFGDCAIDRGCFKGFVSQKQNIHVKVDEQYG